MRIRDLYAAAIEGNYESLSLLIEFLVFEKEVITFDDDSSALDLYFKPNNQPRMNKLLIQYRSKIGKPA